MRRRTFLESIPAAAMTGAGSPADAARGEPGVAIALGFDTYSIRDFRWKAIQLLDYAAGLKLDTIQISSLGDFETLEPAHLARVKDHASRLGLTIDAGIGSICPRARDGSPNLERIPAYLAQGLEAARAVGAATLRCFMGASDYRRGPLPLEAYIEATVKVLRPARSRALDYGVKIAVENHSGDMQARELRTLIEEAGKDFVGACLDIGNPMWVVEDPLVSLEVLAPYVVTTHFRDSVVYEHPRGAAAQWVAMGDGSLDLRQLVARYRELCPGAAMQLEIITGRPPQVLPYLEPDFWKAFPNAAASEFARFVALARHGHPFLGAMMIAGPGKQPPEYQAALREQQRRDLERSLEYSKKVLDVGVRWRS